MKQRLMILVFALTVASNISPVLAHTTVELPKPGLTPDHPLYFLDTLTESVGMVFAFSDEAKTKRATTVAGEKIAEIKAMVEKGDEAAAQKASVRYESVMSTAAQNLAQAAQSKNGFDVALADLVATATSQHLTVLAEVYDRVPEQAKDAIQRVMEKSEQRAEEALSKRSERNDAAGSDHVKEEVQERINNARSVREQSQKERSSKPDSEVTPSIESSSAPESETMPSSPGNAPDGRGRQSD